ncbi:MAG: VCBS repeat-containing protein, partial [Flavobacteriales bacterium]|nr:VCBS repeat-containing protein [Flavobacteriales bacterium]
MRCLELFCLLFVCAFVSTARGQVFDDITEQNNMALEIFSSPFETACSFYDFNQDGFDDVSFAHNGEISKFFLNNGGGSFTEDGECKQICWVDYDNDHDPDLFMSFLDAPIRLYQNQGDLTFIDVSDEVGFRADLENWGACWGDIDNNSWLDLYVCKGHAYGELDGNPHLENTLYRSLGNGTFADVTIQSQVGDSLGLTYQSLFFDYDQDGHQDLMVMNDKWFLNTLYRNNGNTTFQDVSEETSMDFLMDAMCLAADDYDNDLDPDVYVSNTGTAGEGNVLFRNDNGTFEPLFDLGISVYSTCWGSQWIDYDNNGWQDLWNTATYV